MSKQLTVINGEFIITDTVSSVIEFRHPIVDVKHLYTMGFVFFYYDIGTTKVRTRGYLISELLDFNGYPFADYQSLLNFLSANTGVGYTEDNVVTNYIASFESDLYIYSGFIINTIPVIKRCKDSIEQYAQNVTNLNTDWTNRLSLTYN